MNLLPNTIPGANAGEPRQLASRTRWTARVAQFGRSPGKRLQRTLRMSRRLGRNADDQPLSKLARDAEHLTPRRARVQGEPYCVAGCALVVPANQADGAARTDVFPRARNPQRWTKSSIHFKTRI